MPFFSFYAIFQGTSQKLIRQAQLHFCHKFSIFNGFIHIPTPTSSKRPESANHDKIFLFLLLGSMMLLNYKNESSKTVSKYYMSTIYLANTKHYCGNGIYFVVLTCHKSELLTH